MSRDPLETPNPEHPGWEGVDSLVERITAAAGLLLAGLPESVGVILVVNDEGGPTAYGALRMTEDESTGVLAHLLQNRMALAGYELVLRPRRPQG